MRVDQHSEGRRICDDIMNLIALQSQLGFGLSVHNNGWKKYLVTSPYTCSERRVSDYKSQVLNVKSLGKWTQVLKTAPV